MRRACRSLRDGRDLAREYWRETVHPLARLDSRVPAEMPGYFADRYSWQLTRRRPRLPALRHDLGACLADRRSLVERSLVPTVALGGWTATLDQLAELGPRYPEWRDTWHQFAIDRDLPTDAHKLPDMVGQPWLALFDDSVYYPRAPVLTGPTFLDRMTVDQRERLARRYGNNASIDLFCLMHQIHERLHRVQVGEPLLNEVVVAGLWSEFLHYSNLEAFQSPGDAGPPCIQELPVLRAAFDLIDVVVENSLDTHAAFETARQLAGYRALLRLAARHDQGVIRYRQYLADAAAILSGVSLRVRMGRE